MARSWENGRKRKMTKVRFSAKGYCDKKWKRSGPEVNGQYMLFRNEPTSEVAILQRFGTGPVRICFSHSKAAASFKKHRGISGQDLMNALHEINYKNAQEVELDFELACEAVMARDIKGVDGLADFLYNYPF